MMKRRNLDYYYKKPSKAVKESFKTCPTCNDEVFYKLLDVHTCKLNKLTRILESPLSSTSEETINLKTCDSISIIMKTSQKTLIADLNIEYKGYSKGRHQWEYTFNNPLGKVSKPHFLRQYNLDPRRIVLTFSTTHQGSPLSYFSFKKIESFSIHEFKSLLQKAIRRGNRRSAIRTAIQFACNFG